MRLSGTVYSKTLGMDTEIAVVMPAIKPADGGYKVAYLLHGICGNAKSWLDCSMLSTYAAYGNTVYIMPEVARSFYADMKNGLDYFTYVSKELPEICKEQFNISSKREDTAVIGCSMGGYGALKCAFTYPDSYGMCVAFSSCCLFLDEGLSELRKNGDDSPVAAAFGKELVRDLRCAFGEGFDSTEGCDILSLASAQKKLGTSLPKLFLTCGTSDPFYADHLRFCSSLTEMGIPFDFDKWNAGHDFTYFNDALKKSIDRFAL